MKTIFEKYATPISIIVAGALVGVGIIVAKSIDGKPAATQQTTGENIVETLSSLPVVKKLGIKPKELSACINNQETLDRVEKDIQLGQAAGLRGTPHMVVITKKNGAEVQFQLFGALEKSMIEQAIADGKTPDAQASYVTKFEKQVITADDHVQGNPETALATIVEYSDIDCPFCKRIHPTLQQLVDEGKIAWVYRHSPIPQLHPDAKTKAIATECVAKLGGKSAFWTYLDTLTQN